REPLEFTEILIINVENSSVMHGILDTFLLNATAVRLKKKLYRKSNLRKALRAQTSQRNIRHVG
ncbi:hypothetical protein ACCT32_35990, partial [Rhizobium brockwellii]|uniref:hypothetical protein n=1 Tax=Rhizobium brockwellii TaxID=3019932 RepID=UPI003F966062